MTRALRFSCVVLVCVSLNCFADSVRNLNNISLNLQIFPNDGSGDNLGGTLSGKGLSLTVGGGTPYSWLSATDGYAPGSGVGGGTTIYFDNVFGTIGTKAYDDSSLSIQAAGLAAGGATLPTDGSPFMMSVPASVGLIVLTGCDNSGCTTFNVTPRSGTLTISFSFYNGLYYAGGATFASSTTPVPEPTTMAMLAIGIAGLPLWKWRKRTLKLNDQPSQ